MHGSKKQIGLFASLLFGIALILPVAPISVYGVVQPLTQGHMALAYLIAAIPMTLVAYSYSLLAVEFPSNGSSYTFVSKGFHPHVGFVVGWSILMDYGLFTLVNYTVLTTSICELIPGLNFRVVMICCILIIFSINLIGIKGVVIINNILTIFGLLVVSYFIDSCVSSFNNLNNNIFFSPAGFINPDTFSWTVLLASIPITCLSFLGFEVITTLSEDINNPPKVLPKALTLTCIIMCTIFVVLSWFAQCVSPALDYTDPDAAFFDAAVAVGGKDLAIAISLAMITSSFACSLNMTAGITRLMFGMGRDGALPKKFYGYINKRGVPICNIISITIFGMLFSGMAIENILPVIHFGGLCAFICVNLSVIAYFYVKKKMRFDLKDTVKYLIIPGVSFITSFALCLGLPLNAKLIGGTWLICGVIYRVIWENGIKKIYSGG